MAWDIDFRLPQTGFFDDNQRAQLAALFRAIQPRDAARGIPGADDCDAVNFLDKLLAMPAGGGVKLHEDLGHWCISYPQWLAALDAEASAAFGAKLANLTVDDATLLFDRLERGDVAKIGIVAEQKTAFDTILRHCLQGCWADPRWGGNRDRIMWRWLGYLTDAENVAV